MGSPNPPSAPPRLLISPPQGEGEDSPGGKPSPPSGSEFQPHLLAQTHGTRPLCPPQGAACKGAAHSLIQGAALMPDEEGSALEGQISSPSEFCLVGYLKAQFAHLHNGQAGP